MPSADTANLLFPRHNLRGPCGLRIVGRVASRRNALDVRRLPQMRLHTRTIVRDRHQVFLGSQSLRELELDARREVGVIIRDSKVVNAVMRIFEEDWSSTGAPNAELAAQEAVAPISKAASRAAEVVAKDLLPRVAPAVEQAVQQIVGSDTNVSLDHKEVEATVKDAVKEAVKGLVRAAVEDAVE